MTTPVRMAVVGAGGRMGRALIEAIAVDDRAVLAGALDRPGAEIIGRDAGELVGLPETGVSVTDDLESGFADADVILDFTTPEATVAHARRASKSGIAHLIGTTGLQPADETDIAEAAKSCAIVKSGNMSMGVILLSVMVEQAAAALDAANWDIEVRGMHHRHKVDAPSGTALLLGEAAATGRGIDLAEHSQTVRDGHTGPRPDGAIGFATLRGGSVVGDHSVVIAGPGERVTLSHSAQDRGIFARGALTAALWAHKQSPGLYSMRDVLGLNT